MWVAPRLTRQDRGKRAGSTRARWPADSPRALAHTRRNASASGLRHPAPIRPGASGRNTLRRQGRIRTGRNRQRSVSSSQCTELRRSTWPKPQPDRAGQADEHRGTGRSFAPNRSLSVVIARHLDPCPRTLAQGGHAWVGAPAFRLLSRLDRPSGGCPPTARSAIPPPAERTTRRAAPVFV